MQGTPGRRRGAVRGRYDFVSARHDRKGYLAPGEYRAVQRGKEKGHANSSRKRQWRLNDSSEKAYFERREIHILIVEPAEDDIDHKQYAPMLPPHALQ